MPVKRRSKKHHQSLDFIGARVAKYFDGQLYKGEVIRKNGRYWHVKYEDDDEEDYNRKELEELIQLFKEHFTSNKRKREEHDLTDFARNSRSSLNTLTEDSLIHICNFLYKDPNEQEDKEFEPSCIQDISNLGMCSQDLYQVYKAFLETIEVSLVLEEDLDFGKLAFFATYKVKLVEIHFKWGRNVLPVHRNDLKVVLYVFNCCNLSQLRFLKLDKFEMANDNTVDEKYYDFCSKAIEAVGYTTKNSLIDYFRNNTDGHEWTELKNAELPVEFLRFQWPFLSKLECIKVFLPPEKRKKSKSANMRRLVKSEIDVEPKNANILSRAIERMPELKTLELDWIDERRFSSPRLCYLTLWDLRHPKLEKLILGEFVSLLVEQEIDCPALTTVKLGMLVRDDNVETFEKLSNGITDLSLIIKCDEDFKHDELNDKLNKFYQLKKLKIFSDYWGFHEGEATISLSSESLEAFYFLGDGKRHNLHLNCPNLKRMGWDQCKSRVINCPQVRHGQTVEPEVFQY